MTDLMRKDLQALFDDLRSAHAGLLIQRGLKTWDGDNEKPTKKNLIGKISGVAADDLYSLAFKRWLAHTYENSNTNFACVSATINGRLFTGLPLGGALETGVSTHHTYGMPMIPGSSVKGAVRNYAEHLFAKKDANNQIQYDKGKIIIADDKKAIIDVLFGSDDDENPNAGYLIWHDAWWIPDSSDANKPFIDEIVTVHNQAYYQGDFDALDTENPIPNQQIAVQGSFYFVIEGVQGWANYAKNLLEQTIQQQGLGCKGGSGYGYFDLDKAKINPYLQKIEEETKRIQEEKNQQELERSISNLNENQQLVCKFENELKKLDESSWHGKVSSPPKVKIDGKEYGFRDLYKLVIEWSKDDKKYALETVFLPYLPKLIGGSISKNKNWKERINPLKQEVGLS